MAQQQIIYTPSNIFSDIDFTLDTETVVINESEYKGVLFKEIYFAARDIGGKRPRGYGAVAQGAVKGTPLLVIIGDYSHRTDYDIMAYYAQLGYSVFMFDYSGEGFDKTKYTFYPAEIDYANYIRAQRRLSFVDEDARKTSYFEWAALARYAVSAALAVLENKPEKIGVLGIGTGGNIAWMLSATDKRISALCSVFAAGWEAYKEIFKYAEINDLPGIGEERARYLAGISAEAYAKFVNIPVMLLTASNSGFTHLERAYDTIARAPSVNTYICAAPNMRDYICHYDNIKLFFDNFLINEDSEMPKKPMLQIDMAEGKVAVKADINGESVSGIKIYCSENRLNPEARAWQIYDASKGIIYPELHSSDGFLFAYANVTYKSGLVLSTNLCVKNKAELQLSKSDIKRYNIIYNSQMGVDCFGAYCPQSEGVKDLLHKCEISVKAGPEGIFGIHAKNLATFKVGAAGFIGDPDESFKFDVYSPKEQELKIIFQDTAGLALKVSFAAAVKLKGGSIWQPVEIKKEDLKTKEGIALKSWASAAMVAFSAEDEFLINNILWI